MRFRLTYEGEIRPTQRDAEENQVEPLAAHKHTIRRDFHRQLKRLWETNKFLRDTKRPWKMRPSRPIADENLYFGSDDNMGPMAEVIAEQYREFGYRFVPLVREEISLLCSISILFLRRDIGLNFAHRSLAAILKYDRIIPGFRKISSNLVKGVYGSEKKIFDNVKNSVCPGHPKGKQFKTIECSIMDLADDIAYSTYDLEDTFKAGFLDPLSILSSSPDIFERVASKVSKSMGDEVDAKEVISVFWGLFEDLGENSTESDPLVIAANYALASSQLASNGYIRTRFTANLVSEFLTGVECEIDDKRPMTDRYAVEFYGRIFSENPQTIFKPF